jgi:hypothetical protein
MWIEAVAVNVSSEATATRKHRVRASSQPCSSRLNIHPNLGSHCLRFPDTLHTKPSNSLPILRLASTMADPPAKEGVLKSLRNWGGSSSIPIPSHPSILELTCLSPIHMHPHAPIIQKLLTHTRINREFRPTNSPRNSHNRPTCSTFPNPPHVSILHGKVPSRCLRHSPLYMICYTGRSSISRTMFKTQLYSSLAYPYMNLRPFTNLILSHSQDVPPRATPL